MDEAENWKELQDDTMIFAEENDWDDNPPLEVDRVGLGLGFVS